jgi:hypothetical protein
MTFAAFTVVYITMNSVDHREKTANRDEPESECTPLVFRTVLRNALLALRTVLRRSAFLIPLK